MWSFFFLVLINTIIRFNTFPGKKAVFYFFCDEAYVACPLFGPGTSMKKQVLESLRSGDIWRVKTWAHLYSATEYTDQIYSMTCSLSIH